MNGSEPFILGSTLGGHPGQVRMLQKCTSADILRGPPLGDPRCARRRRGKFQYRGKPRGKSSKYPETCVRKVPVEPRRKSRKIKYVGVGSISFLRCTQKDNFIEKAAKEPTNLPPRGKARGASKRSRTYLSNAVHLAMAIRHLSGTVSAPEFREAL